MAGLEELEDWKGDGSKDLGGVVEGIEGEEIQWPEK